jgi:hypothetical protein
LPPAERQNLLPRMVALYQNDPDPGIHGAARWLLKKWEAEHKVKEIDEASRVASAPGAKRGWSVNSQGQTMALIPQPREGVFWMGEGNARNQHAMRHDFALCSADVTVEQFRQFCKETGREYKFDEQYAPTKECPAIDVSWYEAAAYCNWLSKREGVAEAQWCYEPTKDSEESLAETRKLALPDEQGRRAKSEAGLSLAAAISRRPLLFLSSMRNWERNHATTCLTFSGWCTRRFNTGECGRENARRMGAPPHLRSACGEAGGSGFRSTSPALSRTPRPASR